MLSYTRSLCRALPSYLQEEVVSMDIAICIAVLCATFLPLFWVKSMDKDCAYKDAFLLLACIMSGVVVYLLAMVSTF